MATTIPATPIQDPALRALLEAQRRALLMQVRAIEKALGLPDEGQTTRAP